MYYDFFFRHLQFGINLHNVTINKNIQMTHRMPWKRITIREARFFARALQRTEWVWYTLYWNDDPKHFRMTHDTSFHRKNNGSVQKNTTPRWTEPKYMLQKVELCGPKWSARTQKAFRSVQDLFDNVVQHMFASLAINKWTEQSVFKTAFLILVCG